MRKDRTEAAVALSKRAMPSEEFLLCPHSLQVYLLLLYPKYHLSAMLVFASPQTTLPASQGLTASLAVQALSSLSCHFRDHLVFPSSDSPQGCLCLA